jgi:sugar/nucleoside kinase (ribokinase family)
MDIKNIDAVVAGHICLDITPEFTGGREISVEEIFKPGNLINVGDAVLSTGGSVSNTGLALQKLGIKIEFMGKVGEDSFGSIILNKLKKSASIKGMRIVEGESTSYTIVIAPPGIDRIFLHNPGVNDTFNYDGINFELVKKAKLFHLGYPPLMHCLYENNGEQLVVIYKRAKELGAITLLDVSLPDPNSPSGRIDWSIILRNVLPYVDIFLPSAQELLYMLDRDKFFKLLEISESDDLLTRLEGEDLTSLSEKVLALGVKIAGIKCGYRGFYLRTAGKNELSQINNGIPIDLNNWSGRELWVPAYHVPEIITSTGSGDSAIAGFLAAFLRGKDIEPALNYACAVGAQSLEASDAVSGIRSWDETTAQIEKKCERNRLIIKTPSWKFNKEDEFWEGPDDKKRLK